MRFAERCKGAFDMSFVHFLMETPVAALLVLLVLLVTVVPIVAGLLSRRKKARSDTVDAPPKELPSSRFLGTQMDLAILIFGLLLLLALAAWVIR
jgi:hypothetical protein